ncbi:hypothetical protein BAE44_0025365, partial [Dichanthelium oligosanthes]
LAWDRSAFLQSQYNDKIKYEELKAAQNQLTRGKNYKRAATELPLLTLTIGNKKCQYKNLMSQPCRRDLSNISLLTSHFLESILSGECTTSKKMTVFLNQSKQVFFYPLLFYDSVVLSESYFRSVFLEIEKGMLEKGLAKLLYIYPTLQRTVEFVKADQHMYQGHGHAHTQQTNTSTLQPFLPSANALLYIGGRM